ncbi:uncharacterized protein LOC135839998 [Planococcus citri]|uniref:uncharacterized protein LOC135839998 n=1 Tax=Planococcus citri TaxID=170843 RepID=UPI0031F737E8
MRTTCSAEEIEDELNELKLRIAKMNARRNAQINLLQRNIADESSRSKIFSKPSDTFRRNYLGYPSHYYWPFLHPYKYSSWNDLLDTQYMDDFPKKSPTFLSKKDDATSDAYKLLEQKVQSDVLRKLKRFVLDQEHDITDEFLDKLILHRKPYTPKSTNFDNKKLDNKARSNSDLKLNSDDKQSPFLKPINKSDNFYKRYNSFMKRIMKPLRKISPPLKSDNINKFNSSGTLNTNWKYKQPLSYTSKYFPPKINKPSTPIKSPLNDLDVSYLRPWQKYSPIHRNYFDDYEYVPKNYRVPKDVETIIRDMEFENRRTYPFMSTYPYGSRSAYSSYYPYPPYPSSPIKYDPYESDSYVRSTLPTWKQYYYTQKLRSKPSHERFVDYYDPYRDFFCDAASVKSEDMNIMSPNKDDLEVNSINSDNCSALPFNRSYDSLDDLRVIDDYRDSIYDEIIKNLRNQQRRKIKKNKRFASRSFTPGLLRNDRSLYNYRITEPNLNRSYSWKQPNTFDSTYNKYNFKGSSVLSTDDKWKSSKYENITAPSVENKFTPSKCNLSSPPPPESKLNTRESIENQESEFSPRKYSANVSSQPYNQLKDPSSPTKSFSSPQKYADDTFSPTTATADKAQYQIDDDNSSPKFNNQSYKFTPLDLDKGNTSKEAPSFSVASNIAKVESPVKETANSQFFEKDQLTSPIRRSSIFENKQYSDPSATVKQSTNSPKKQSFSLQSNPPSPVAQIPELNATVPGSMSRKNSAQYATRKGSIQTSSIDEEPGTFSRTRRYSKDQSSYQPEMAPKSTFPGPSMDKRLSYGGSLKEPISEVKEEKIIPEAAYDSYSQYKEHENIPKSNDYTEEPTNNRFNQYQPQNYERTVPPSGPDTNTNPKYQETPYYESSSAHPSNYNRYPDSTNDPNYNERYYNNQYDSSNTGNAYKPYNEYTYPDHKNEYNDQYNYPTRYDETPGMDSSSYADNRAQYKDTAYTTEKRPSNESYQAADPPRATEYEKYQDEDYKPDYYNRGNRNAENLGSMNQNDNYAGNKYGRDAPQDDNYNADYGRYQQQDQQLNRPYREDFRTGAPEGHGINDNQYVESEPKSFEHYSYNSSTERDPNDQSHPYSGQNSLENTNYPSGENRNEPVIEKISDTPMENVKPVVAEQIKAKDRKKSLAVESSQESETPVVEPPPKEVSISRRTSKAALTLAEQRRAAAQLAEKNKIAKAKVPESKLKRTPSVLKTKPPIKKT